DVDLHHLAAVAVGIGPGLFTGLRVGVTTAKVLAQSLRVPVVTIPTLDLIAYPLRHGRRVIVAVLDARRHEVFHAAYRPVPGGGESRARGIRGAVGGPADVPSPLRRRDRTGTARVMKADPLNLTVEIVPMRRRHLRAVMRIEQQVYPRPWSTSLFLSELALRS